MSMYECTMHKCDLCIIIPVHTYIRIHASRHKYACMYAWTHEHTNVSMHIYVYMQSLVKHAHEYYMNALVRILYKEDSLSLVCFQRMLATPGMPVASTTHI